MPFRIYDLFLDLISALCGKQRKNLIGCLGLPPPPSSPRQKSDFRLSIRIAKHGPPPPPHIYYHSFINLNSLMQMGSKCSFFLSYFGFEEKVDPTPWPLFPAGIKGLSDTCDPGNTFTRPKQGHHSNWHQDLPLQARCCAHAR